MEKIRLSLNHRLKYINKTITEKTLQTYWFQNNALKAKTGLRAIGLYLLSQVRKFTNLH